MLHIHNYTLNDQISFQAIPIKQSWGNSFATKIDTIEFSLNVLVGLVEFSDWRYLSFYPQKDQQNLNWTWVYFNLTPKSVKYN